MNTYVSAAIFSFQLQRPSRRLCLRGVISRDLQKLYCRLLNDNQDQEINRINCSSVEWNLAS